LKAHPRCARDSTRPSSRPGKSMSAPKCCAPTARHSRVYSESQSESCKRLWQRIVCITMPLRELRGENNDGPGRWTGGACWRWNGSSGVQHTPAGDRSRGGSSASSVVILRRAAGRVVVLLAVRNAVSPFAVHTAGRPCPSQGRDSSGMPSRSSSIGMTRQQTASPSKTAPAFRARCTYRGLPSRALGRLHLNDHMRRLRWAPTTLLRPLIERTARRRFANVPKWRENPHPSPLLRSDLL
jgi:hypothetical protein